MYTGWRTIHIYLISGTVNLVWTGLVHELLAREGFESKTYIRTHSYVLNLTPLGQPLGLSSLNVNAHYIWMI